MKDYLIENGLPKELVKIDTGDTWQIGEVLAEGVIRNLLEVQKTYGEYADAVADEVIRCYNASKHIAVIKCPHDPNIKCLAEEGCIGCIKNTGEENG